MYIRRTHTNQSATGERYYTYRLVQSERVGAQTRQSTLLNLGRHFAVEQAHWPTLCARVEDNLRGQSVLLAVECSLAVEREAQRIAAQLLARQGGLESPVIRNAAQAGNADGAQASIPDIQSVDVDSLELHRPRSVGVEQVGLWAMRQLGLVELLQEVGLNGAQRCAIIGSLIARLAAPGSELAAHRWLGSQSGLGELLDAAYEAMPLMALYRASDALWKRHARIESALFSKAYDLFALETAPSPCTT